VRIAPAGVAEPDGLEQLVDTPASLTLVAPADPQAELDVLLRGHVREQRVRLEHHPHVALVGRDVRDVLAVDDDAAAVRAVEAGDEPERGRLAAARRPEQRQELALSERDVDAVQRPDGAEVAMQVLQLEKSHGRYLAPASWSCPPRRRPMKSRLSIAAHVIPKLINVKAAAPYGSVSFTYCRKIGNVWNCARFAIVNSPITIASARNEPASAAARMFGRITRTSVTGQLAPRLCDASVSVCTSIDRKPASSEKNMYGNARITYVAARIPFGWS